MAANDMNTTPRNVNLRRILTAKISTAIPADDLPPVSLRSSSFLSRSCDFAARSRIVFNQ
jgi:hypothetical protein